MKRSSHAVPHALGTILLLLAVGYVIAYVVRGELVSDTFTYGKGESPDYLRMYPSELECRVFSPAAGVESLIRQHEVRAVLDSDPA